MLVLGLVLLAGGLWTLVALRRARWPFDAAPAPARQPSHRAGQPSHRATNPFRPATNPFRRFATGRGRPRHGTPGGRHGSPPAQDDGPVPPYGWPAGPGRYPIYVPPPRGTVHGPGGTGTRPYDPP